MVWIKKVTSYLRSVRSEVDKVSWPSQDEVVTMTILIIGMVILLSAYIGGFLDLLFKEIVRNLIGM
ncbi:MAG: preprotein translocase subunit SecE [Candidatus Bipolaricaulota bacterium]